jgi:hypothetical protein
MLLHKSKMDDKFLNTRFSQGEDMTDSQLERLKEWQEEQEQDNDDDNWWTVEELPTQVNDANIPNEHENDAVFFEHTVTKEIFVMLGSDLGAKLLNTFLTLIFEVLGSRSDP